MGSWLTPDGDYRLYGTDRAATVIGGEYSNVGANREVEFKIDLTTLTATETILDNFLILPIGARIKEVEVITHTAAATGTAIDVGMIKLDRTTEGDYDGFLAAFPTASMDAAGENTTLTEATTYNGALIGTTLTYAGYLSASRTDATAFTAGIVYLKIRYYVA